MKALALILWLLIFPRILLFVRWVLRLIIVGYPYVRSSIKYNSIGSNTVSKMRHSQINLISQLASQLKIIHKLQLTRTRLGNLWILRQPTHLNQQLINYYFLLSQILVLTLLRDPATSRVQMWMKIRIKLKGSNPYLNHQFSNKQGSKVSLLFENMIHHKIHRLSKVKIYWTQG